jgi:thiamine biosynthesis lipoprotein
MISRRRFLSIAATWAALGRTPSVDAGTSVVWRGQALGGFASITLQHPDRARARAAMAECTAEIERLENVFSLYRPASALSRLNAHGGLDAPPHELVELMAFALELAAATEGAFDPTVQPLYRLYAEHFARPGLAEGPDESALAEALTRIGYRGVEASSQRIGLSHPGMAVTLNGVAQGFITDRVADLLRGAGFAHVLVNLGEIRVLGPRQDGRPWRVALDDPRRPGVPTQELRLGDSGDLLPALATSAATATMFAADPRFHHLLDPRTGRCADHYVSVSVSARRATIADGLSTALSILPPEKARALLAAYPGTRAYLLTARGTALVEG